jgi:AcrR family transcriptional regulator
LRATVHVSSAAAVLAGALLAVPAADVAVVLAAAVDAAAPVVEGPRPAVVPLDELELSPPQAATVTAAATRAGRNRTVMDIPLCAGPPSANDENNVPPSEQLTSTVSPRAGSAGVAREPRSATVPAMAVSFQPTWDWWGDGAAGMSLKQHAIERDGHGRHSAEAEIQALIDATFDVIAATGTLDPPIRPILDTAQLSRQVFYRHFGSKDELLLVVLDESRQIVGAYLRRRMARAEGASAQLRAYIDGAMRQAQDPEAIRRTRPFAVTGRRLEARFPEQYARSQAALTRPLADVIRAGVEEGVFESRQPDADAQIIYDAVFLCQNRHLLLRTTPTRKTVDDIHDFAARALRPHGTRL